LHFLAPNKNILFFNSASPTVRRNDVEEAVFTPFVTLKPLEIPEAGCGKSCHAGRLIEAEGNRPYRLRYLSKSQSFKLPDHVVRAFRVGKFQSQQPFDSA